MSGRVLVVGSVNIDLVVRAERLPEPGETVLGGTFGRFHGGKGGNQAVAAARLGAEVALVAALGADTFGDEALEALAGQGVHTSAVYRLDGSATGVALILVDAKGENLIAVAPGANAAVTEAQVPDALGALEPVPGDVVLVVHEIPTGPARAALRLGRERGATTVLNPAPATGLDRAIIALADVLTPNRGELARLASGDARRSGRTTTGAEDPIRAARTLLEATSEGPGVGRAILVSLGAVGGGPGPARRTRGRHRRAAGHRRRRHGCGRHAERGARGRAGRGRGPRDGGPPRGRRCQPVRDAGRGTRGNADEGRGRGGHRWVIDRRPQAAPYVTRASSTQVVCARAAGVMPSRPLRSIHHAASPRPRASSRMP